MDGVNASWVSFREHRRLVGRGFSERGGEHGFKHTGSKHDFLVGRVFRSMLILSIY